MSYSLLQRLDLTLPGWTLRTSAKRWLSQFPNQSMIARLESGSTMLTRERLRGLESHLRAIDRHRVPGAVVECGVAAGGSAALLGLWLTRAHSPRPLFLFDTFEGLPAPTIDDPDYDTAIHFTGRFRGELADIQAMFARLGITAQTTYAKGLFQDTLPHPDLTRVAFAHLDGDWYDSTAHCLRHLWPLLSPGGRIQFDDYGAWQGCRKAVDEFLAAHGPLTLHRVDSHGVWLERPH